MKHSTHNIKIAILVVSLLIIIGGHTLTQAQDTPPPTILVIDNFDYTDPAGFKWELGVSQGGSANLLLDAQVIPPDSGNLQSLIVETIVPCVAGSARFQYLQLALPGRFTPELNVLEFWIRGDGQTGAPFAAEFTITLIEGSGEIWKSSRLVNRSSTWKLITINLTGQGTGDPFDHSGDFIIPTASAPKAVNQVLDVADIRLIRMESLTTNTWACGTASRAGGQSYPSFKIWIDQIVARQTEVVRINDFDRAQSLEDLSIETQATAGGTITPQLDNTTFAPTPKNVQSLQVQTNVPCIQDGNRDAVLEFRIPQAQRDWRNSRFLELWIRGDGATTPAVGGKLTVSLVEDSGEIWSSIRRVSPHDEWRKITISLSGNQVDNPRNHPLDFVMALGASDRSVNGVLDLDNIKLLRIGVASTNGWACGTAIRAEGNQYPNFTLWIDDITRR
jgi:hypothetical protein